MCFEEVLLARAAIKTVKRVQRDRFWRQCNALSRQVHVAHEPALEQPLGLFALAELQVLDGCETIDMCQQGGQLRYIINSKIWTTLREQRTRLRRARTRQHCHC